MVHNFYSLDDYDALVQKLKGFKLDIPVYESSQSTSLSDPKDSNQDRNSSQHIMERMITILYAIEKIVTQYSTTSFANFGANHELRVFMKQFLLLILHSNPVDDVALIFCQKVVQMLYKTQSILCIEVNVILLMKICEISPKAAKEVIAWIIYADDERKFNVTVTAALFTAGVINVAEYDAQLARFIETGNAIYSDFAINLIRKCVLSEVPVFAPFDFVCSMESLAKSSSPKSKLLLEEVSSRVQFHKEEVNQSVKEPILGFFKDWLRLCQYPSTTDKLFASFIQHLNSQGLLSSAESCSLFFRTCLDASIDTYIKHKRVPSNLCYQSIDSLAKLLVQCVKAFPNESSFNSNDLWICVLKIIAKILLKASENKNYFLQKPINRFFNCLFSEVNLLYESTPSFDRESLFYLAAELLEALNPLQLPSFAFAWIDIVANRNFMPVMLQNQKVSSINM